MTRTTKIINLAIEQAKLSTMSQQHGAILTKGSKIIARGYNHSRSHFMNISGTCIHAEIATLLEYCNNILHINVDLRRKYLKKIPKLNKCILWVVRICTKENNLTESKPCSECISNLKKMGIKKIGYSNKLGNIIIDNITNINSTHLSNLQIRTRKINKYS